MSLTIRRTIRRAVTAVAVAGAMAIGAGTPASASVAPAADLYGCPSGAVCIYQDGQWDHVSGQYITHIYWAYGAHNLVNQYGYHWVVNNQYGGPNATVMFCTGYNGTNCTRPGLHPGGTALPNLTPINSIVLNRP